MGRCPSTIVYIVYFGIIQVVAYSFALGLIEV